jgi:hypothetical protein
MTNKEFAERLQVLAALYKAEPELDLPYKGADEDTFQLYVHNGEQAERVIRAFGPGVKREPNYDKNIIEYLPERYPGMCIRIFKGGVCQRVKVGEREVERTVIPAKPEFVVPAHVEEVWEWRCGSLLAGEETK